VHTSFFGVIDTFGFAGSVSTLALMSIELIESKQEFLPGKQWCRIAFNQRHGSGEARKSEGTEHREGIHLYRP
jgi:hypothetical protein